MNHDVLDTVANKIEALGYGTVGTDIFIGQLPADTDGIYLVRTGGTMNNYIPIEETIFTVYVNYASSQTAIQKLESIKRDLHRTLESGDDNSQIYAILAMGDIEDLGREIDFGKVYLQTFTIKHRAKALIS